MILIFYKRRDSRKLQVNNRICNVLVNHKISKGKVNSDEEVQCGDINPSRL